jgi:hypothetical protein
MRPVVLAMFAIFVAATLKNSPAFCDSSSISVKAAQSAIQSAYDNSNAAGQKLDMNGMFAKCAQNCMFNRLDGDHDDLAFWRRSFAAEFKFHLIDSLKTKTKIMNLNLKANVADVSIAEHQVTTSTDPFTSAITTDTRDYICRDIWLDTNYGWRETSTTVVSSKTYEDGKLLPGDTSDAHW